tara:strand:- start:441 stop:770 length:330 start_codon:yes stop_codon:yes gene_type:complete
MNKIKKAVEIFKANNPTLRNQDVAQMLFPEFTETRSREKLSRLMNGYELDTVKINDLVHICKTLNIEVNDLLSIWENELKEPLCIRDLVNVCNHFNLNLKELINNYETK